MADLFAKPIYVDAAIHSWRGMKWCHLFSEDIEALHEFAARLGLKREWFQEPPFADWPHYDTIASRRLKALKMGAIPADKYKTLEIAWKLQGRLTPKIKNG